MAPKKKQEKMNLGEFLTNQSLGSWADEMDNQPMPAPSAAAGGYGSRDRGDRDGGERRAFTQPSWERGTGTGMGGGGMGGGMGRDMGGRGTSYDRPRFSDREPLPLPSRPPYTAHLGNLTYEVTQSDVEGFFKDCQVTNVRIVEDKVDQRPKGFGYVEFATLEGLKQALTLTETNFMGRNVKISIAEPPKERADASRDFSDWSRKGPLPDLPQNQRQPSNRGFSRNFNDNMSDAGSERGGSRKPGFFEGDGKTRDFSDWSRKGPLSPVPNAAPPFSEGGRVREGRPQNERRESPAWGEARGGGEGRSDAGSRPPRPERVPTAAEQDTQWRARMRPDPSPAPTPDVSTPSSPQQPQAPKERPRLNLQKRTVSTAVEGESASNSATDAKASPFGAARPIDTATREREVAEKREVAIREKKEADAKEREEKTQKETAARAARAERADRGQAQEDDKVTSPVSETGKGPRRPSRQQSQQNGAKAAPKENGEAQNGSKASFSILRRDTDGGEDEESAVEDDGDANGTIVGDKETKPQEVQVVKNAAEGAPQNTETTADALEEDGWATVPAKTKNNRRGGGRAIAS